jgi:C4-type Zn-finger protein
MFTDARLDVVGIKDMKARYLRFCGYKLSAVQSYESINESRVAASIRNDDQNSLLVSI